MFRSMNSKVLLMAALLLSGTAPALAHAKLVSSAPEPNAMAMPVPAEIRLTFSEPMDPALTRVQVSISGPRHESIAIGDMGPDTDDLSVYVIHLASQRLPNGLYTVAWKAECVDGHKTSGSFAYDAMK